MGNEDKLRSYWTASQQAGPSMWHNRAQIMLANLHSWSKNHLDNLKSKISHFWNEIQVA